MRCSAAPGRQRLPWRDHLRLRRTERLDHDLRRDAAGRREDGSFPENFKRISKKGSRPTASSPPPCWPRSRSPLTTSARSGADVFTTLVLMTGFTSAIPYGFSALAQMKWHWADRRRCRPRGSSATWPSRCCRCVLGPVHLVLAQYRPAAYWFTIWAPFFLAGVALVLGIPVYRRQRRRMTPPPPSPRLPLTNPQVQTRRARERHRFSARLQLGSREAANGDGAPAGAGPRPADPSNARSCCSTT